MCIDPRVKSCNSLVNILARAEALASGADEVNMLDLDGTLRKAPAITFFWPGIGLCLHPRWRVRSPASQRATVLELASISKIPAHETRLTTYDVCTADEVFVTGSGAGIVPVTEVDRRPVAGGRRISGGFLGR